MKKVILNNTEYKLEELSIDIRELKFNPFNARIHSISSKISSELPLGEKNLLDAYLNDETQEIIYKGFLTKYKNDSRYKDLRDSIIDTKGLYEERMIYITSDNVVLSGNTRLSIMKKLLEENADINPVVKALKFLDPIKTKNLIDDLEDHLQHFAEEKVDYETFEKWMKVHSSIRSNNEDIEVVAKKKKVKTQEILKQVNTIDEYYKMLRKFGDAHYTNLFQELDVSSALQHISNDLKSKNTEAIRGLAKEIYYKTILTSLPFNKVRDIINTYLGIKSESFNNDMKIDALRSIMDAIENETFDVEQYTKTLISESKPIKSDIERREMLNKFDHNILIANLHSQAASIKDAYENTDEEFKKGVIKEFTNIINRINKKTDAYYDSLEEVRKIILETFKED